MQISDELRAEITRLVRAEITRAITTVEDPFLNMSQVSARVRVSRETLRTYQRKGRLPKPSKWMNRLGYFVSELPEVERLLTEIIAARPNVGGRPRKASAETAPAP